ncbi:DUF2827 domain-containing protein [Burkholderia vietnamiensis]|uniref:DUF2827 domain-containing protein n=1 Tax=Burkholderia vietnamiensis TaxID=60552 RepID=UPI000753B8F5|nr:DUF2827 domain-containing protein [Burkholderia vietnamiensis]KVF40981.1 hypothetical protein WJ09_24500 [Burkholderia vietnamiensis]
MRIGISVLTHTGQNIWENGLGQNVLFLAQLLRQLPLVSEVVLLNMGDQSSLPAGVRESTGSDFRLVNPREMSHDLDVVIEMGGGLDVEWLDYMRALGTRVVFYCCGNPYAQLIEPTVFGKPGFFSRAERCDEIWILPQYERYVPMMSSLHRCRVEVVPYLWSPQFLAHRAAELRDSYGLTFGYVERAQCGGEPGRAFRAAIFEPNISVVKSCVVPMLICEEALRIDEHVLNALHVLNSAQMKDHLTFSFMTSSLDLVKHGRVCFEQRHDFVAYMAQHADMVVSHQWNNDQNYLYLDALYGGYPLVHNSPWIKDLGYYYPEFDIEEGARKLIEAARTHDAQLSSYNAAARELFVRLNPLSAGNMLDYTRRLIALDTGRALK